MRLQVKGRNVEVSDSIRRYAEEKLGKLSDALLGVFEKWAVKKWA